ncbi:MAG: LPXTG cell wall anchor domain-containing protein [Actinomycetota bacterium]
MSKDGHSGTHPARRITAALTALMTATFLLAVAAPSSASAPGPYHGFSTGTVAHVHALDVMGTKVADVELGQSNAAVNSGGLATTYNEFNRPIVPKSFAGKKSYGEGSLAEVGLGVTADDANQIAPFVSTAATSGGSVVDDKDPLHIGQANPLLWVDGLHTTAIANWNANNCVIGQPISSGFSRALNADAVNIDPAMGTNADDSFKQALVNAGVVESTSFEQLYAGAGDGLGLASVAATRAVHLAIAKGTANELDINVAPAFLVVKVDGTHHSNVKDNIDYIAPIAQIKYQDQIVNILTDFTGPQTITIPPCADPSKADVVLNLNLGTILPLESKTGPTIKTLVNSTGTEASASVNVLDLTVLKIPEVPFEGAHVSVGHLEAASSVPAGGISCPIPVTKTPDNDTVSSGQSFTTTITVDNPWSCPLVLSKVSDDINTIEGSSTFDITDASPGSPSITSGSGLTHGTVTWSSGLPTIDPGKSATFTVTLKTGGGGGKIKDIATAEGAVSNCKPAPGSGETTVTGITNAKVPVTGTGTLTVPETNVLGLTKLPRTGVADSAYGWAGLMMLLTALAGGFALRKRSPQA